MEKRTKAVYSFEIKKEIVDRHATGETMMDLAKEFNLSSRNLVGKWTKQHCEGGDEALMLKPKGRPKGSEKPAALSEEDKLRRELKRVQAENAYLKKLRDLRNQGHA
ncbi:MULTISPECIES: helix-turn-helix domain-containing protein [unclassified Arthrobacter]|uniref:helix-turn-helix domain-containing protein n=1 Tax=unclassified Arthrobacter TaxID=235627 RepID=UPI001C611F7E|nr:MULTISPECIES: helix-turn-helix domain-containing protein [unclassified Arthrobacter]